MTGRAPGRPRQTGQTWLFGAAPSYAVEQAQNIFETVRGLRDMTHHLELAAKRIRANPSIVLFGGSETPEELRKADETELRLKGRARRYDKEDPK